MVYIFFNVPYVVFYHLAKLELKTPLVYREIKRQIMLRVSWTQRYTLGVNREILRGLPSDIL
jgi:hypothetical protein